jgi:NADH-quinone oxidoreductase subunit M
MTTIGLAPADLALALQVAIWLPIAGALVITVLPRGADGAARWVAALFSGIALLLALLLLLAFARPDLVIAGWTGPSVPVDPTTGAMQFVTRIPWIPQLNISYAVGLDGISLPMFVLNALLVFLAVLVSWRITLRPREYFALILVLETAVAGVFASLDFFLFFLFWELELAPMFLLIGIWGSDRREYAAMKFILYTVAGSAFMLVGILALYVAAPAASRTFDMMELARVGPGLPVALQMLIWLLLFVGFAVKVPIFPFHTWLPDAHTEAPTAISVLLAGVLLKMGGYGIIRANIGMLPEATREFAWALAILAVISVVYGGLVAMVQRDLKRVIANSSISHMGYVVLGAAALTPLSMQGAVFQMFAHGTITGLLFVMVGLVYDRTHTRQIDALGGLGPRMPFIAATFLTAALASLGLPGLSGFVAEFLVFLGSFPIFRVETLVAIGMIVLTAGYMLWLIERVFFGPERTEWTSVGDASGVEKVAVCIFLLMILLLGVFPFLLADIVIPGVTPIAARYAL